MIKPHINTMMLTKANIARALTDLGFQIAPSDILKVEVWAFTVWVKARGLCRIMSWNALISAFNKFRREKSRFVEVSNITEVFGVIVATATSTGGKYRLELGYNECWCSCEDYQQQIHRMGPGALCKHGWKLISFLGRSPQSILSQQKTGAMLAHC